MRKLATIRKIDALTPITGADAIECAHVGGWKVVVKKGEYNAGDLAVYLEIDSWVPTTLAPFLSKGNYPRVYNEVEGERLKTVKLRGQVSQGLLLPVYQTSVGNFIHGIDANGSPHKWAVTMEQDVSELLNIVKWEPAAEFMSADSKGAFPSQIPKTDQERIQNLSSELAEWKTENLTWEVTEKLEGSSMTAYLIDGEFGVCSRNLNLKPNPDATFWKTAIDAKLEEALRAYGDNIAVQGELIGEGIQGNIYKLKGTHFYIYDIYDITTGKYFVPAVRRLFCKMHHLNHVPDLVDNIQLEGMGTMDDILAFAEGKSMLGCAPEREGLVFKCNTKEVSFKAISNRYLLKSKD
jgi:RNA ligase (TIGR02306 family)